MLTDAAHENPQYMDVEPVDAQFNGSTGKVTLKVDTETASHGSSTFGSVTTPKTTSAITPGSLIQPVIPPPTFASLTPEQKERLAMAKAYAKEQTLLYDLRLISVVIIELSMRLSDFFYHLARIV
ncbi:hypothetical protein BC829DRAFT_289246 [Chytridium lagenaria]|nr:hypothetical protein BC829DRAFT_289246 [Chytridium lagenaria]